MRRNRLQRSSAPYTLHQKQFRGDPQDRRKHHRSEDQMIELPSVTLFCADCVDADRAIAVMEKCKSYCNFGAVRFLTSLPCSYEHKSEIMNLSSLVDYSIFMLTHAVDYVDTPHMLVVQHDGYIINPGSWNPEWLKYDYIGPLFIQDREITSMSVGSGGFSLRSRALMQYVKDRLPTWEGSHETERVQPQMGCYEDGV